MQNQLAQSASLHFSACVRWCGVGRTTPSWICLALIGMLETALRGSFLACAIAGSKASAYSRCYAASKHGFMTVKPQNLQSCSVSLACQVRIGIIAMSWSKFVQPRWHHYIVKIDSLRTFSGCRQQADDLQLRGQTLLQSGLLTCRLRSAVISWLIGSQSEALRYTFPRIQ